MHQIALGESLLVLQQVAELLTKLETRYAVTGSLASGARGELRSTNDIDLVLDLCPTKVAAFCAELAGDFLVQPHLIQQAAENFGSANIIHDKTVIKVDLFFANSPFSQSMLARASLVELGQTPVKFYIATTEDILLAKLVWYRKGNEASERQARDIAKLLELNHGQLELDYLEAWAKELQVEDLLKKFATQCTEVGNNRS